MYGLAARAAAKLTVYENEETFKQLCDNVIMQWVEKPDPESQPGLRPGESMELIHASAAAIVTRQTQWAAGRCGAARCHRH